MGIQGKIKHKYVTTTNSKHNSRIYSNALASLISEDELNDDNVIADAFDPRVVERESEAVAQAAIKSGVARI